MKIFPLSRYCCSLLLFQHFSTYSTHFQDILYIWRKVFFIAVINTLVQFSFHQKCIIFLIDWEKVDLNYVFSENKVRERFKKKKKKKKLTNVSFAFTHTYTPVKTIIFRLFPQAYMENFKKCAKPTKKVGEGGMGVL